jgi:hypothetical protein
MPDQHSQFARHRHRGNLMATFGPDADKEGVQRPRRFRRRPGGFHQHGACVAAPDLADTAVMGGAEA